MIQQTLQVNKFKQQLRVSLQHEIQNSEATQIAKDAMVYIKGDKDETVYFIESVYVKLVMRSPRGKECIIAIHTAGDVFGELYLSNPGSRKDTAIAMEKTELKKIPFPKFLSVLSNDLLTEDFIKYLALRIADLQQVIANF